MRGQKGFVFLDALAGIVILSIGLTCIMGAATGARQAVYLSQWKMKAANAVTTKLEQLKAKSIQDLLAAEELIPGMTVPANIDDIDLVVECQWVDAVAGLLEVKVTAHWASATGSGEVAYATLRSGR